MLTWPPAAVRRALHGAALAPALAASPPADPHPAWWAEWQRLRGLYNSKDTDKDSPEGETLWAEFMAVEDRLRSIPATTPEGLCAQFEYMAADIMGDGYGCVITEEIVVPFLDVFRTGLARL